MKNKFSTKGKLSLWYGSVDWWLKQQGKKSKQPETFSERKKHQKRKSNPKKPRERNLSQQTASVDIRRKLSNNLLSQTFS